MSFLRRSAALLLGFAALAMSSESKQNASRKRQQGKKKPTDHEKLEKHYQSCGLKKFPLVKRYVGHPILNAAGQPLHVYALNERNHERKIRMYSQNPKSIPTFA